MISKDELFQFLIQVRFLENYKTRWKTCDLMPALLVTGHLFLVKPQHIWAWIFLSFGGIQLLILVAKGIQNPKTSRHHHCYRLGSSLHHLLQGLLKPVNLTDCFLSYPIHCPINSAASLILLSKVWPFLCLISLNAFPYHSEPKPWSSPWPSPTHPSP